MYADCLVEFDRKPVVAPGETLTGRVTLTPHTMPEQKHYRLRFLPPEGWQVECAKNLFTPALHSKHRQYASAEFTIRVGENVDAVNRVILEITWRRPPDGAAGAHSGDGINREESRRSVEGRRLSFQSNRLSWSDGGSGKLWRQAKIWSLSCMRLFDSQKSWNRRHRRSLSGLGISQRRP